MVMMQRKNTRPSPKHPWLRFGMCVWVFIDWLSTWKRTGSQQCSCSFEKRIGPFDVESLGLLGLRYEDCDVVSSSTLIGLHDKVVARGGQCRLLHSIADQHCYVRVMVRRVVCISVRTQQQTFSGQHTSKEIISGLGRATS